MLDDVQSKPPAPIAAIRQATEALGFSMASDVRVGTLLRTLAAGKSGGTFLELGTGTGFATAWILDGMDRNSTLVTVDSDEAVVSVARQHLGTDPRATFVVVDGGDDLATLLSEGRTFDLVFADAWSGKYTHVEEALQLLATGGMYVVDDMLPQPKWAGRSCRQGGRASRQAALGSGAPRLCPRLVDWRNHRDRTGRRAQR